MANEGRKSRSSKTHVSTRESQGTNTSNLMEGGVVQDESKQLLTAILSEIRDIKKQNESFREETRKELEELRNELKARDDKWDNERNSISIKIDNMGNTVGNRMDVIEKRMQELERSEEFRQKRERRNNILIKSAEIESNKDKIEEEIQAVFNKLEVETEYEHIKYIGKDWKGRGMALVRMRKFEDKIQVMKSKSKLAGKECFIESDMTREERKIQAALRGRAKEERERGNEVKVGYQKISINGRWEYWYKDGTKNKQPNGNYTTTNEEKTKNGQYKLTETKETSKKERTNTNLFLAL